MDGYLIEKFSQEIYRRKIGDNKFRIPKNQF